MAIFRVVGPSGKGAALRTLNVGAPDFWSSVDGSRFKYWIDPVPRTNTIHPLGLGMEDFEPADWSGEQEDGKETCCVR